MPNDDYIKRSDAIRAFAGVPNDLYYTSAIVAAMEKVTAADVEPVRHGRWIDENPASPLDPRMRCSVCGHVDLPLAKWRFCPMCSAKMDKEAEDAEIH